MLKSANKKKDELVKLPLVYPTRGARIAGKQFSKSHKAKGFDNLQKVANTRFFINAVQTKQVEYVDTAQTSEPFDCRVYAWHCFTNLHFIVRRTQNQMLNFSILCSLVRIRLRGLFVSRKSRNSRKIVLRIYEQTRLHFTTSQQLFFYLFP